MKKGFSLVVLVITITVMLIIVGAVILSTEKLSDKSKAMLILDEMKMIKSNIYEYQLNHEENAISYPYKGTEITNSNSIELGEIVYGIEPYDGYYLLEKSDFEQINIKNIENAYLVNYLTQDIVYKEGIDIEGETYYTIEEINKQVNILQN